MAHMRLGWRARGSPRAGQGPWDWDEQGPCSASPSESGVRIESGKTVGLWGRTGHGCEAYASKGFGLQKTVKAAMARGVASESGWGGLCLHLFTAHSGSLGHAMLWEGAARGALSTCGLSPRVLGCLPNTWGQISLLDRVSWMLCATEGRLCYTVQFTQLTSQLLFHFLMASYPHV